MNYWTVLCARPDQAGSLDDRRLTTYPLPGGSQSLAPAQLASIVTRVAGDQASWRDLVRYGAAKRWYRRLAVAEDHEVWLLSWLPGQGTGFHDHGDSAGAFTVVQGSLHERVARGGRPHQTGRLLQRGAVRSFGRSYVHDVRNDAVEPAVSIHAYSPPLAGMRRFEFVGGELRQASTEGSKEVRTW